MAPMSRNIENLYDRNLMNLMIDTVYYMMRLSKV